MNIHHHLKFMKAHTQMRLGSQRVEGSREEYKQNAAVKHPGTVTKL